MKKVMKKVTSFFVAMFFVHCVLAQQAGLNPDFRPTWENLNSDISRMDGQGVITWLTSEVEVTSFGNSSGFTLMPLMEFNVNDIKYFDSVNGKLVSIEKIMFFLNSQYLGGITSRRVVILQGTSLNAATEKFSQSLTSVSGGWNTVTLDSPYQINPDLNLYIGYEIVKSNSGYPISLADCTNPKQGWYKSGSSVNNLTNNYEFGFLIKAIAGYEDPQGTDIRLLSLDFSPYAVLNDMVTVNATLKNIGSETINSFSAYYKVDNIETNEVFTDLEIESGEYYEFSFSEQLLINEVVNINIEVKIYNPNDEPDDESDNTLYKTINVVTELVPRIVFHEGFSSSTCGYCPAGNAALKQVLDAADPTKFTNIKYQMNWPGTGDPYYTAEGNNRRGFYGVQGVPDYYIEGKQADVGNYSVNKLNELSDVPAKVKMESFATRDCKSITFDVEITPVSPVNNNLRLFVAIVEKVTTKNKKSNGETYFYDVMKKFMTSPSGDAIPSLTIGEPTSISLSYSFNGEYRLPGNANSPINHAIEHSVEDFSNLKVVYWIQNISTKEIWQSGKVDPEDVVQVYVNYDVVNDFGTIIVTSEDENIESGDIIDIGNQVIFTAFPDDDYEVKEWKQDGKVVADYNTNEFIIESITCSTNISVEFQTTHVIVKYDVVNEFGDITAIVEEEDDIESGDSVLRRSKIIFSANPEVGYEVKEWRNNGALISGNSTNEFIIQSINADANVTVEFQTTHVIVNYDVVNEFGSLTAKVGEDVVESGDPVLRRSRITFTATPEVGYEVKEWRNNGTLITNNTNEFIIQSLNAEANVTVEFQTTHLIVNYDVVNEFGSITAKVGTNGVESGDLVLRKSRVIFTAIPNDGYEVLEWKYNGDIVLNNKTNEYIIATLNNDVEVTVEFTESVGIGKQVVSGVQLYPNPVTKSLTISNAENVKTVIFTNIIGQTVKEIKLTGQSQYFIYVDDLKTGIYLVTIQDTNGERVVHRVVKQN